MPSSYVEGKQAVAKWVGEIRPLNAIDIGPGVGTYQSIVAGNYGQWVKGWILGEDADGEFVDYRGPKCYVIGIEAYYPYVERYKLNERYDQIIIADVRYVDWKKVTDQTDVVFCGDVLEHLTKSEALILFNELNKFAKNIIISLPIVHFPQGAFEGNPFEEHKVDNWSHEKFVATFGNPHKSFQGKHIGVYWYKNE